MSGKPKTETNNGSSQKEQSTGWINAKAMFYVVTRIMAPSLSDFSLTKRAMINYAINCWKKYVKDLTDDDIEVLSHLDRVFKRTGMFSGKVQSALPECMPYIPGTSLSKSFRQTLKDQSIVVKGFLLLNYDNIGVDVEYRETGAETYEFVLEGSVLETVIRLNKKLPEEFVINLGAKKDKGYGIVNVRLNYL